MAAGHNADPARWRELFDELVSLVAGRFGRVEPRRTALDMVADAAAARMAACSVAADELCGDNGAFRAGVAKPGLGQPRSPRLSLSLAEFKKCLGC